MHSGPRRRPRACGGTVLLAVGVAAAVLAGCAPQGASPEDGATATAPSMSAPPETPTPSPATAHPDAPVLDPTGTAADNLPLFHAVTARVWAGADRVHGRAYVDALVEAGFDKKAMQVTQDRSTVGNPAESIQFSVRWRDGQCLIGQVGPATGDPVTVVMPGLADGRCLIGATRPIDW